MPNLDLSEKRFEHDIEAYMIKDGGLVQFSWQDEHGNWMFAHQFDKEKQLYVDVLVDFIKTTQPKEWKQYTNRYPDAEDKLVRRLNDEINRNGLLHVLRNGITDMGIKLKVCYFKPESELNEKANDLYKKNIVSVTRQFAFAKNTNETIDMVLSVNGIPVVAIELKNQFTNQNYQDAIDQYKRRDEKEPIFKLNYRFLVYFAVDHYDAYMTTQLKGKNTYFLPFNQGSNGAGQDGGAGNPANPNGYSTSYLWEEALTRDSLLDLIRKFISYKNERVEVEENGVTKVKNKEYIIFPRFHQFDVVHKVVDDIREVGPGHNYLIQHSAGSGKSNSIAWIAYRLASLFNDENIPVFSSIIVVTNRIVLDSQLQDTINGFDHTPGLVEAIDDKKGSRGLVDAINDHKRIIICTIQKFLFAYKDFNDLTGHTFAVIIDEAHQGQNGKASQVLKSALLDKGKALDDYAKEEGVSVEELSEGDLLDNLIAQGKHKNQSFLAFTATPKNKTLESFGSLVKKDDGSSAYVPFHIYSMRQAIEEGFIIDVLQNYVTIQQAFKLVKVVDDNPVVIESSAHKALVRYYKEHGHTIAQKVEVIMSSFLNNGRCKINGHGKAMIVADSRQNAVRYFFAIKDYLKSHPQESLGSNVLVAFSGSLKVDGKDVTEADLNFDKNGKSINSDKKFRKAIRSDDFNIMVVADKYQTGFDEPLLHSMYVDKKLKGVNAVQTLSRLNRPCPGKDDVFVLDFENTEAEVKGSFSNYYTGTILEGISDYNAIYDIRTKITEFMIYTSADVDNYYNLMVVSSGKKQTNTTSGRLSSLLKPIVDRYGELSKEGRDQYRGLIKLFNKTYSFIAQLVRLHDEELFKEFLFTSHLISWLYKEKPPVIEIDDKIKLEYASLTETFKGAIKLDKGQGGVFTPPGAKTKPKKQPKKDTLQSIIQKVNDEYSGNFTEGDRVIISGILNMFMNDEEIKKYRRYAKDNNPEMFIKSLFPDKFKKIVTKCFMDNNDTFQKLFNDSEFYNKVMEAMAKELYQVLRKDEKVELQQPVFIEETDGDKKD